MYFNKQNCVIFCKIVLISLPTKPKLKFKENIKIETKQEKNIEKKRK